jgi:hypothetical protein
MSASNTPRQLRVIIEAPDFDEADHFCRDVLGMRKQPAFATGGDDRVSILHAGHVARGLPAATTKGRSPRSSTTVAQ